MPKGGDTPMNENERAKDEELVRLWLAILTERYGNRLLIGDRYAPKPVRLEPNPLETDGSSNL